MHLKLHAGGDSVFIFFIDFKSVNSVTLVSLIRAVFARCLCCCLILQPFAPPKPPPPTALTTAPSERVHWSLLISLYDLVC